MPHLPAPAQQVLQVLYGSKMSWVLAQQGSSAPRHVSAAPIAVVGAPLSGDPALPRPLALQLLVPVSSVEALGERANLPAQRRCVVALAGADPAADAALRELAAFLAAPAAVPGGEAMAAGVLTADGAAHFFVPPCEGGMRLILAARQPGAPPMQPLTAAGVAVSLLLSDAAAEAAAKTRADIGAALQARAAAAAAQT